MPKFLILCLTGCAGSVWTEASEGCMRLRENAAACADAAHAVEAKIGPLWKDLVVSYPLYGSLIFAVDSSVTLIEGNGNTELERNAAVMLRELLPQRRVYVRLGLRPVAVQVLMPPAGSDAQLRALVEGKQAAFRECFRMATTENGDFSYKGVLVFTVTDAGDVADARVEPVVDAAFSACVIEEARALKLPAWQYTGRVVRYPLQFEVRIKKRGR